MSESHTTTHNPQGKCLSMGHVLAAAKLHTAKGGGWGFSNVESLTPEQRANAEASVLYWAVHRGYDVADVTTWMDTKSARHFANDFDRTYTTAPDMQQIGDHYFPLRANLLMTAKQEDHGWMIYVGVDTYELLRRGVPGEYVDGKDFEYAATNCADPDVVGGATPLVRTGGTRS